jgi:hypothetical protein
MRKIARFQVHEGSVHALCVDGTFWVIRLNEPGAEWHPAPDIPDTDSEFEEVEGPWRPVGVSEKLWAIDWPDRDNGHLVTSGSAAVAFDQADLVIVEAATFDDALKLLRSQNSNPRAERHRLGFGGHEFFYLTDQVQF